MINGYRQRKTTRIPGPARPAGSKILKSHGLPRTRRVPVYDTDPRSETHGPDAKVIGTMVIQLCLGGYMSTPRKGEAV